MDCVILKGDLALSTYCSFEKLSKERYIRYTLYPVYVISGIRYIRFALYRVCAKKLKGDPFVTSQMLQESLFLVYVISGFRYIRFALNLVWVV